MRDQPSKGRIKAGANAARARFTKPVAYVINGRVYPGMRRGWIGVRGAFLNDGDPAGTFVRID